MNIIKKLLSICFVSISLSATSQVNVVVNFDNWSEFPLVKKFGVYQTPLTCQRWLERDLPKLSALQARTMRYEIAWGKKVFGYPMIMGTKDNIAYDFSSLDYFCDSSLENCQSLILSQGYCPDMIKPFRDNYNTDWRQAPTDYNTWAEINGSFAAHYRQKGYSNHYIEVWNEPDLNIFFLGTLEDYKNIYRYAAPAIRKADSDVKVGGPTGAFSGWHKALVEMAKKENLPLDFISGHAYDQFEWQLNDMRSALKEYGNPQAEMLLTEFAPYPTDMTIHKDGLVEQAEAAMTFFNSLPRMLEYTDLTHVTWAQYIDPGDPFTERTFPTGAGDKMGLLDGEKGFRKSLYNAFLLYGRMPINRRSISIGNNLKGMASAEDGCVAAVIWNPTYEDQQMMLSLTNIPFTKGRMEVYQIDKGHNSWYETGEDELVASIDKEITIQNGRLNQVATVLSRGVYFIIITAPEAFSDPKIAHAKNDFAKIIRIHQCYDERSSLAPYAIFDSKTWSAYLSDNMFEKGRAIVGVCAENLPQTIEVETLTSGNLKDLDQCSTLNLRIDYHSHSGDYTKAVVYHGDIHHPGTTLIPEWGTSRQADQNIKVENFSNFKVEIEKQAPSDWDGRAIITFEQTATGKSSKTNFRLSSANQTYLTEVVASDITKESALLTGSILGSLSKVTKTGFILKAESDPRSEIEENNKSGLIEYETELNGNEYSCVLTGLDKDTNYHVRGFFVDASDKIFYTPECVFHTPAEKASLSFSRPGYKGDIVTLSAVVLNDNGSEVYERGFLWTVNKKDPIMGLNSAKCGSGDGLFTTRLGGFETDMEYEFWAYAKNAGGLSLSSTSYILSGGEIVTSLEEIFSESPYTLNYDLSNQSINAQQALSIELFNMAGTLLEHTFDSNSLETSTLEEGLYICRAIFPGKITKVIRFLK